MLDIPTFIGEREIFKPTKDINIKPEVFRENIVVLLSGKANQILALSESKRKISIKHKELSYIGLEEILTEAPHIQKIKIKAGSEFVLYKKEEFLTAFQMQLNLTYNTIIYLCQQIRLHSDHLTKSKSAPKMKTILDDIMAEEDLEETLYNISFSDENNIPVEISEKILSEYPADYKLIEEGEYTNDLYIILEGQVSVYQNVNGERRKVAVHKSSSVIGEMALFDGRPRSATIITDIPTKILVFKPENFKMVFLLHPKWSLKIIYSIASRMTDLRTQILRFGTLGLENI